MAGMIAVGIASHTSKSQGTPLFHEGIAGKENIPGVAEVVNRKLVEVRAQKGREPDGCLLRVKNSSRIVPANIVSKLSPQVAQPAAGVGAGQVDVRGKLGRVVRARQVAAKAQVIEFEQLLGLQELHQVGALHQESKFCGAGQVAVLVGE